MTKKPPDVSEPRLNPQTLDWNLVKSFVVVAHEGSLSKAANRLHISQPTLSRQISEMEATLKVLLFERTGRGVRMTEVAEALLAPAEQMLAAAQGVCAAVSDTNTHLSGTVRITTNEAIGAFILPDILGQLAITHPGIKIELVVDNRNNNVLTREADIAIRIGGTDQGALIAKHLGDWRLGFYASPAYASAIGGTLDLRKYDDYRWIGIDQNMTLINRIKHVFPNITVENFAWRCDNFIVNWMAVKSGLGLGIMFDCVADNTSGVQRIAFDKGLPTMPIWLISHRGLQNSARLRVVFDYLVEHLPKQ